MMRVGVIQPRSFPTMIAAKDKPTNLTPEEYFAWEEQQLEKHELIDGEVYAMTGGSVNHSRIAIRFTTMSSWTF